MACLWGVLTPCFPRLFTACFISKDFNLAAVPVTGPAVGIGQELAYLLAKDRYQLISVDQNAEGLRRFADHLRV